jgi:hypothetical protein
MKEEEKKEAQLNVQSSPTGNIQTAEKQNNFEVQRCIPWIRSRCSAVEEPIGTEGSSGAALTKCHE